MSDEMKVGTRKVAGSDAAALAQHAANRMVDAPACTDVTKARAMER